MTAMVCVPDWQGAAEDHWQSRWLRGYPNSTRVGQRDGQPPSCDQWVQALQQTLDDQDEPVVLVAHGLGCSTVAHWAAQAGILALKRVKGALLVAPPDVQGDAFCTQVPARGFAPESAARLPFPSIVVASADDPFCSQAHAAVLAESWGSEFVPLASVGHIDGGSRLGEWRAGQKLLQRLMLA